MTTYRPVILLVVASSQLRDAAQQALVTQGYEVLIAEDGGAAVAYLRETAVPPHLMIADTRLRDVKSSVLATEAGKRGTRVLPIASHRFRPTMSVTKVPGFDLSTLMTQIATLLGPEAATS